jgi:parvulin-like peptidyl-prolyl isomerase
VPGGGEISKTEFDRVMAAALARGQTGESPKPGDPQYEELRKSVLNSLLERVWLEGIAEDLGIKITPDQLRREVKKVTDEQFKSRAEYRNFLKEQHLTRKDVEDQVKVQKLNMEVGEELKRRAPKPTQREIEDYYEAVKARQYTRQERRGIRQIVTIDRTKARLAREGLDAGNSVQDWERLAKKYSERTMTKGAPPEDVTEEFLIEPLRKAVFDAPLGEVAGPLESEGSFHVFEVANRTPGGPVPLGEVESEIEKHLAERNEPGYLDSASSQLIVTWTGRTFCAAGYVIERCANFKGGGHSAAAGCYEAHPEGGRPEDCAAPVLQLMPALPGTVSPISPKGVPRAQRPQPTPGAEAREGAQGAPGGAAPGPAE